MRRRSELGRGGLGTGPGRSGSDRVGRRGRSDEQASGSPGHEARTAPIGIAEAGEWLADSPPPGARRPPAAGRCEGIEPGCGTDWPGVGEVGGGWDVRCPGLWPCGASLTGERPPGPAGRTIADDLGAAATEEKRAGGAAAVTEVDGLDLLCDDLGFCSAAPPLAPPAPAWLAGSARLRLRVPAVTRHALLDACARREPVCRRIQRIQTVAAFGASAVGPSGLSGRRLLA